VPARGRSREGTRNGDPLTRRRRLLIFVRCGVVGAIAPKSPQRTDFRPGKPARGRPPASGLRRSGWVNLAGGTRSGATRVGIGALAGVFIAFAATSAPAVLHVRHLTQAQKGLLYAYKWVDAVRPGVCAGTNADGTRHWGRALRVSRGGHKTRIVFRLRTRPDSLTIRAWRRLDGHGAPVGRARKSPTRFRGTAMRVGLRGERRSSSPCSPPARRSR
jgi:hypothetical protein